MNDRQKLKEIFRAKEQVRKERAKLPIMEKVSLIIQLQKMANVIRRIKGRKQKPVWRV